MESGLATSSIKKKGKLRFICNDRILGTGAFRRNIKSVRLKTNSGDLAQMGKFSRMTDTEKLLLAFIGFFSSFQLSLKRSQTRFAFHLETQPRDAPQILPDLSYPEFARRL